MYFFVIIYKNIQICVLVGGHFFPSFTGKGFMFDGKKQWRFTIGDTRCYIYEKKPFKFKVTSENSDLFSNNQVAGH
jgi:hypothetical protein